MSDSIISPGVRGYLDGQAEAAERIADLERQLAEAQDSLAVAHSTIIGIKDALLAIRDERDALKAQLTKAQLALTDLAAEKARATLYGKERDAPKIALAQAREALRAWQIRLAFVGHPNEPKDWSEPVRLTELALAALDAGKETGK